MMMGMVMTVVGEDAEEVAAVAEDTDDLVVEVEDTERKEVADGRVELFAADLLLSLDDPHVLFLYTFCWKCCIAQAFIKTAILPI